MSRDFIGISVRIGSAIKFYLEKVCGMQGTSFPYVRPKKEQKLPNVLGQNEVLRLLSVVENR